MSRNKLMIICIIAIAFMMYGYITTDNPSCVGGLISVSFILGSLSKKS